MSARFGPVVTAMVTPFRDDSSLDLDGAQALTRYLLEHGSDGLVVAGSTGESPTLTHAEKRDLFRAVVEAAQGSGRVICGTGTYSTQDTVELTKLAEDAGADGVLIVTPYYNKPPQRGIVAHFQRVAAATDLPILAYNIPSRTGTRIEHQTMLTLAEIPNVVGVKDSVGDFDGLSRLIAEAPADFEVYSGDDSATFAAMSLGAVGIVSVAAHLVGNRIRQMVELLAAGDVPAARKVHQDLSPLFAALFVTSNPIPVKTALEILGRSAGPTRLPLVPATSEERETIRRALEDAGLV